MGRERAGRGNQPTRGETTVAFIPKACRCGAPRLPTGQCAHCDTPRRSVWTCTTGVEGAVCKHCTQRDAYCVICKTWRGNATAAGDCEKAHRAQEIKNAS